MAYGDFKDFTRRTASKKILFGKTFDIAKAIDITKYPKYDGYQAELASVVFNLIKEEPAVEQSKLKLCLMKN